MQLQLTFSGSLRLPMSYRHQVQSMLYHALDGCTYGEALHDGRRGSDGRQFKLFTFGQLEGSYRLQEDRILFPEGAMLEVRSADEELLRRLFRHFIIGNQVRIGSNTVTVSACAFRNEMVDKGELEIVTASPIVAYITEKDGHTRFFSPEDPQFYSLVAANARRKWQMVYGDVPCPELTFTPVAGTKFRKQVTQYKTTRITAWHGRFHLSGQPQLLDLLYHTGLGAKSSQGFGMFFCLK